MLLDRGSTLWFASVHRSTTVLYQPTCLLHYGPDPWRHMSLHPLINIFGVSLCYRCCMFLAFPFHHSVIATTVFLTISALWIAASSFWNLYSSHALLNCSFWEASIFSILLSLVYNVLSSGLIWNIEDIYVIYDIKSPDITGLLQKLQFS